MTSRKSATMRNRNPDVTGRVGFGHWSLVIGHLLLLSGCSTMDWTKKLPWNDPARKLSESKFDVPVRIVAIWTPTTLSQPGKPQTRELGGRLYFYNEASQAIPVEG